VHTLQEMTVHIGPPQLYCIGPPVHCEGVQEVQAVQRGSLSSQFSLQPAGKHCLGYSLSPQLIYPVHPAKTSFVLEK